MKQTSRIVRSLLGMAGGLLLVFLVVRLSGVSFGEILGRFRSAHPGPIIFAVLGVFVLFGLQALRWWCVIRATSNPPFWKVYQSMLVGFAGNAVLPARAGDLLRIEFLSRSTGVTRANVLATGIVDIWSDKWGWIASFLLVCLMGRPPVWAFKAMAVITGIVAVIGLVLVVFWKYGGRFGHKASKLGIFMENFRAGLGGSKWKKQLLVQTFVAPLSWFWETIVILQFATALDFSLTPVQAFAVLTAFNLAMVIPAPGNAGTFEASSSLALMAVGVPKESAIAFGFLYHLSQLIPGTMAGAIVLFLQGKDLFFAAKAKELEGGGV